MQISIWTITLQSYNTIMQGASGSIPPVTYIFKFEDSNNGVSFVDSGDGISFVDRFDN